jgi:hypothetical protein
MGAVYINREQFREQEFLSACAILGWLGYDLYFHTDMIYASDYIIDKRSTWFTNLSGAVDYITMMHPKEMREYRALQGVDSTKLDVYTEDPECAS